MWQWLHRMRCSWQRGRKLNMWTVLCSRLLVSPWFPKSQRACPTKSILLLYPELIRIEPVPYNYAFNDILRRHWSAPARASQRQHTLLPFYFTGPPAKKKQQSIMKPFHEASINIQSESKWTTLKYTNQMVWFHTMRLTAVLDLGSKNSHDVSIRHSTPVVICDPTSPGIAKLNASICLAESSINKSINMYQHLSTIMHEESSCQ